MKQTKKHTDFQMYMYWYIWIPNFCFKHEVHVISFLTLQCLHMFSVVAGGPPPNLLTCKI